MNKTCIIITGPTASGKTAVAINMAQHFGTEIISADSRQCYRELDIGVAKPSPEELNIVHHYFINSHSISDDVNAAVFEKYSLESINKIFEGNNVAVMVGGTGLYICAFCHGLDLIPAANAESRQWVLNGFEEAGITWLQEEISKYDPVFVQSGEMHNPQRLMRALEIIKDTGKSILEFQTKQKISRPFNIITFGLDWPRQILYDRINHRVDNMIDKGLVAEARKVYPDKHLNALQTVGYKELFRHFDGELSLEEAINLIKQNTRHYAKRQETWFKKEEQLKWIDGRDSNFAALQIIREIESA